MRKLFLLSLLIISNSILLYAQRGKDGAKTVSATEVVNAYTSLTANASTGNTSISVANSNLNNNFVGNLSPGDLIMIIQIQGVSVEDTVSSSNIFDDSRFHPTWGRILNYNNCGNYEFIQVSSVPNATTINLDCALSLNYTASSNVVIVRVPRYLTLTINGGGILTTDTWNGTLGGILAVEVNGTTTINAGGSIDASSLGFRGGQFEFSTVFGGNRYASTNPGEGGEKGEGIAGDWVFYDTNLSGRYTRGAAANAGGGGTAHNAGGGGGSNAGTPANWNDGVGIPDPLFNAAWALESPSIVGLSNSGGGRGGYSHAGADGNELTQGPGNATWGGDLRREMGGLGGRPLDYSTGKIFLGGGGGAGDGEDTPIPPGAGGNGAGIIFLSTYGDVNGTGNINANGQDGFNCEDPAPAPVFTVTGKDAAGGAGAGGTVIIKTTGTVSGISINANGGNGGNQVLKAGTFASIGEAEGAGGGGGGGYIAITSGSPTNTTNGGFYGTTNSPFISNFPANGATSGGFGMPNESIDAFNVTVNNDVICPNTTSTLTAIITGTAPAGATIEWYNVPIGGSPIFTGNPFTTPSLSANTTYYVSVCPAPFRVPVTVTVNPCPAITASFSSTDSTLCEGDCINFADLSTGSSATGWIWSFPGAVTTSSSTQNPTNICYNNAGSFDVELIVTDGSISDTLLMSNFIIVGAPVIPTFNPVAPICSGDPLAPLPTTSTNTITGTWSPVINNTDTTLYTFTPDPGQCATTTTITIIANPLPDSGIDGALAICSTDPATDLFLQLSGTPDSGGTWSPVLTSGTGVFDPATDLTGTYTYTVTNSCGSSQNDVVVTVTANPSPGTNGTASICGNAAPINLYDSLNGTPSAGGTWSPVLTSGTGILDPTVDAAGTYTYSVTDCAGNPQTADVIVTINPLPTVTANSPNITICSGDQITLTGGGATSYLWDNGATDGLAFIPLATTTYTVTGTDANGCSNTAQILITVNNCAIPPVANLSASSTSVCINDCVDFTDLSTGGVPTAWLWYFFNGTPSTSNNQNPTNICYDTTGTYDVALMVSNAFGQDSIFIANYITVDSCTSTPNSVIIPNVLSPNGDGQNDLFNVSGSFTTLHMEIYNRWGKLMFKSDQLNEGWNGRTTAGAECPDGTYFYIITTDIETYKGALTLIR